MTDFTPVELQIEDLAYDGKSVAHRDGKVVFLKGGLPGERVLARITRSRPRYDDGYVTEVLDKSPHRIAPRCEHVGVCGGCTWQDLLYQQQLAFKTKQVQDCLERLGQLPDVPVLPALGAAEQFGYRNKMEFSFHGIADGGFTLGLHRRGKFDEIFDVHTCHLQDEVGNKIVRRVREFAKQTGIPVYDVRFHRGFLRFLVIRHARSTGQVMINLVTNYGDFPDPNQLIETLRGAAPKITTVVQNRNGQKSNIAVGESEQVLYGPGFIEERLSGMTFRIRANSFFQTNTLQAATLYQTAFDQFDPQPHESVLDLYCGGGAIGILLAPRVRQVIGVELAPAAVHAATETAAINGIENIGFYQQDVSAYLRELPTPLPADQSIIIDPPRAGMHPKVLKRLIELRPHKLLYISCNPATFARDARVLVAAGYHLPSVTPVDMFPHTMHIELVGRFGTTWTTPVGNGPDNRQSPVEDA